MTPMSAGRQPRLLDRFERRFLPEVGRRDARIDDVALADAGSLEDPFVRGLDQLFEIGIGQQPRRHIGGQRGDPGRTSRHPASLTHHLCGGRWRLHGACRKVYHSRESLPGASSPK